MKENTNKIILVNSAIMMIRLAATTLCALLSTRFALKALGVTDFGLFALVGNVITFITIFNTIMLSTSNRFISVAIGRNDMKKANEQFNINLLMHFLIAVLTFVVGFILGNWYIYNYVNFDGDIEKAVMVFDFSLVGSVISFIAVPYNGLLMAKEKFSVFSVTEVLLHIIKTLIAYSLIFYFTEKLLYYALSQSVLSAMPTFIYYFYCRRHYPEIVQFRFIKSWPKYREVVSFSSWIAFGAFANIGQTQGAAILVNVFFNTAMNAALGIANTIKMFISSIANNVSYPAMPQITKSYSAGNMKRSNELLIFSTKYTYLVMLLVSAPILAEEEWLLSFWLGNVPPFVSTFTTLIIIDTLITSLNSGISTIIFASGKIRLYQISVNVLRLLAIVVAYIMLKEGRAAYWLFYIYICCSAIICIVTQWVLHHTLNYDNAILFKHSYLPSLAVTLCLLPLLLFHWDTMPLLHIIATALCTICVIYIFGLTTSERNYIQQIITSKVLRK